MLSNGCWLVISRKGLVLLVFQPQRLVFVEGENKIELVYLY